jgi:uncharacterized protein (DUF2147 family)
MNKIAPACMILLLLTAPAWAAAPDSILGVWYTQDRDAKVQIYKCADRYCGKIVWLEEPNYPPGSKEGIPGTPKIDINNPNPRLKAVPLLGLTFMRGFAYVGDSEWKDGTLYNPEKGKTYRGQISLASPDQLNLRGFVGISLFGRTSTWTRVPGGNAG